MKHLNPRQGITTAVQALVECEMLAFDSVKHLNPRQGITTFSEPIISPSKVIHV